MINEKKLFEELDAYEKLDEPDDLEKLDGFENLKELLKTDDVKYLNSLVKKARRINGERKKGHPLSAVREQETDRERKRVFSHNRRKLRSRMSDYGANDGTLTGKCLVYIGLDKNDLYKEAVIYITDCTADSVKGVMINKLLFGSAVLECKNNEENEEKEMHGVYENLYQGGPVNPASGFVLFPSDGCSYNDAHARIVGDIAISSSFGVLQDILEGEGPNRNLIALGHCVWKRGELEWEIFNNEWLIVPGDANFIFDTRFEDKWEQGKQASGIKLSGYIPTIGLA